MSDPAPTRSLLACVVFADIVGYSKLTNLDQFQVKQAFTNLVQGLTAHHPTADLVRIDTGDGCAVAYLNDFSDATEFGIKLLAKAEDALPPFKLRVGINIGPVKTTRDFNGTVNLVGDGINVAQRIMSFAGEQELAISGAMYDILIQESSAHVSRMLESGHHDDKHGRAHRVYLYDWRGNGFPAPHGGWPEAAFASPPAVHTGGHRALLGAFAVAVLGLAYAGFRPSERSVPEPTEAKSVAVPPAAPVAEARLAPAPPIAKAETIDQEMAKPSSPIRQVERTARAPSPPPVQRVAAAPTIEPAERGGQRCSGLLDKVSLGVDPLTAEETFYLKRHCR